MFCLWKEAVQTAGETDTCAWEDESDSMWPGPSLLSHNPPWLNTAALCELPTWCHSTNRMEVTVESPGILCLGPPQVFIALSCHASLKGNKSFFFSFIQTRQLQICVKICIHMDNGWKKIQMKNIGRHWSEVFLLWFYLFSALFLKYMRWL